MSTARKQARKPQVKKKRPGFRGEPSELGEKILAALARLGMNGRDLARMLGCSESTVSRWIAGSFSLSYLDRKAVNAILGDGTC